LSDVLNGTIQPVLSHAKEKDSTFGLSYFFRQDLEQVTFGQKGEGLENSGPFCLFSGEAPKSSSMHLGKIVFFTWRGTWKYSLCKILFYAVVFFYVEKIIALMKNEPKEKKRKRTSFGAVFRHRKSAKNRSRFQDQNKICMKLYFIFVPRLATVSRLRKNEYLFFTC